MPHFAIKITKTGNWTWNELVHQYEKLRSDSETDQNSKGKESDSIVIAIKSDEANLLSVGTFIKTDEISGALTQNSAEFVIPLCFKANWIRTFKRMNHFSLLIFLEVQSL